MELAKISFALNKQEKFLVVESPVAIKCRIRTIAMFKTNQVPDLNDTS